MNQEIGDTPSESTAKVSKPLRRIKCKLNGLPLTVIASDPDKAMVIMLEWFDHSLGRW